MIPVGRNLSPSGILPGMVIAPTAEGNVVTLERLYAVEVEVPGEAKPRVELVRAISARVAALEVDGVVVRVCIAREVPGEGVEVGQEVGHAIAA